MDIAIEGADFAGAVIATTKIVRKAGKLDSYVVTVGLHSHEKLFTIMNNPSTEPSLRGAFSASIRLFHDTSGGNVDVRCYHNDMQPEA